MSHEPFRPTDTHPGAGVQLEFASQRQIISNLDQVIALHPEAQLVVLGDYTLDGPVPDALIAWCRHTGRYLVVGGKDPVGGYTYYDTAFVVSPAGEVVFHQGKSVPLPFFDDGLPAPRQAVWDSPWGRIGICVCFDLSFTRVTDELIRQGAQILVVPSMDLMGWGAQEHTPDAEVTPVRAAEYGVPIFRIASSGISQAVDQHGRILASARFPGQGDAIFASFHLPAKGTLPIDRWLGPISVGVASLLLVWLIIGRWFGKSGNRSRSAMT